VPTIDATSTASRPRPTVSVVIPALNEAATVGAVVAAIVDQLHRDPTSRIVDEVVVVDGGSQDATALTAAAAGARVLQQGSMLGGAPVGRGKGDALWQGLAATTGELVVFIDADIRGFDPAFVSGLIAPLVADPAVLLTKAAYDRPLGTTGSSTGGGRVTELLARPVLATFWPELGHLAQPLSGEYAGRRALLASLPFVQGYGVEIALLIDIAERYGADAIRQVDLGVRHHAHQPLDALGRMAAELLQVALSRAARSGRDPVARPVLRQPSRATDGSITLTDHHVSWAERPPAAR
jgi:glucosyl-3-phosphoglycerate synthase